MTWAKNTPRKIDFALAWLVDHPKCMAVKGRDLERSIWISEYRNISSNTWNKAKRLLKTQGAFPDWEAA